ncbi:MAG: HWE histidine kinase domain-containing protein [Pseudomonadota bacterium]
MSRDPLAAQAEAEALAACSAEPIHIPGLVQPFGSLLGVDAHTQQIDFVADNVESFLGIAPDALLGASLSNVLGSKLWHAFNNARNLSSFTTQRTRLANVEFPGGALFVTAHAFGDRQIVEFERLESTVVNELDPMERIQWLLSEIAPETNYQPIIERACGQLRAISGFDRVKAYRFLPDGAGEVQAESRASHMESFLGLRFPAYDVPDQAKALYQACPIRLIADVQADPIPIRAVRSDLEPLDLSLAITRGTSPVHLQYLANMGVRASMSLPIICEGALWGLFAFHSATPLRPDPMRCMALELAGKLLSLQIEQTLRLRREHQLRRSLSVANRLVAVGDSELSTSAYWHDVQQELGDMLPNDGLAYVVDDVAVAHGEYPSIDAVAALRQQADFATRELWLSQDLSVDLPQQDMGTTAGALVIPLGATPPVALMYFRKTSANAVRWAGAPTKELVTTDEGTRLHPRASFGAYAESVATRCDGWSSNDLEVARSLQQALAGALERQRDSRDNRHRLGLVVRELNHRVRNILALISSMTSRLARPETETVEGYADALRRRIVALAEAHNMLTDSSVQSASLERLARMELEPFMDAAALEPSLMGPPTEVRAEATPVLVLLLHELTSNAVKYGALSVPQGRVRLSWDRFPHKLVLRWREFDGPSVAEPARRGFGRTLIEGAAAYELGGRSDLRFMPHGVEVDIEIPGEHLLDDSSDAPPLVDFSDVAKDADTPPAPQTAAPPARGPALVLEDSFVIATELADILQSQGFAPVDCAGNLKDAKAALERKTYSLCVLDVNVRGETSFELARRLVQQQQPFIFSTGYGSEVRGLEEFRSAPVLTKPVFAEDIARAIDLLGVD